MNRDSMKKSICYLRNGISRKRMAHTLWLWIIQARRRVPGSVSWLWAACQSGRLLLWGCLVSRGLTSLCDDQRAVSSFRHHNGAGECANSRQMERHQATAGCKFVVSERCCVQIQSISTQWRYLSTHLKSGFGFITACHWLQKYQQGHCFFYSPYGNTAEMTEDKCRFCLKENENFQQSKLEHT